MAGERAKAKKGAEMCTRESRRAARQTESKEGPSSHPKNRVGMCMFSRVRNFIWPERRHVQYSFAVPCNCISHSSWQVSEGNNAERERAVSAAPNTVQHVRSLVCVYAAAQSIRQQTPNVSPPNACIVAISLGNKRSGKLLFRPRLLCDWPI